MRMPTPEHARIKLDIELREMWLPRRILLAIAVLRGGVVHIERRAGSWHASV